MTENQISRLVYESALKVHRALGPGLLESAYEECLCFELNKHNLQIQKQAPLPLIYEEVKLNVGFRADILVNKKVILEIKAVDALNDIHMAQVLTYLKVSGCKLGMLINFNVLLVKDGIRRIVNNL